jgi:hypothetical protein
MIGRASSFAHSETVPVEAAPSSSAPYRGSSS